jgi:hypothetical protein
MAVDVLTELGVARDYQRQQPNPTDVADQAGPAVADGDLSALERVNERSLVEEVVTSGHPRRRGAAMLHQHVDARSRRRELIAPGDEPVERVMIRANQAKHERPTHSSSPMTVALRKRLFCSSH